MAAKDFLVHINMNKQQLLNAALQVLGTAPSSPFLGQIYWNSTDKTAYVWTGTAWLDLGEVHKKYTDTLVPNTPLSGANIISQITLENGHVTGVSTRALTASEIGAASATHTHVFGDITNLPAKTILANDTNGTANAKALTVSQFLSLLAITYGTQADLTTGTSTANSTWSAKDLNAWITTKLNTYLTKVDLSLGTRTTDNVPISNSAGTGVTIPSATQSLAGVMTSADKAKLDGVQAGANNYVHPQNNPGNHPFANVVDSGLQILSQLVVNTEGHVIGVSGRNLTAADIASVMIVAASNNVSTTQTWSAATIHDKLQTAIGQSQTGALIYKGEYNPVTNTPNIQATGLVKIGHTYVVSTAGSFLGQNVEAGDMIIAKVDDAGSVLANWQLVNKNIPEIVYASLTSAGLIQIASTQEAIDGQDNTKAITPLTLRAVLNTNMGFYSIAFGNGTNTNFVINHGLNSTSVDAVIRRVSTRKEVIVDWEATSASSVTINVNEPPANNELEVLIYKLNRA